MLLVKLTISRDHVTGYLDAGDHNRTQGLNASGPLMTTAMTLFGDDSWLAMTRDLTATMESSSVSDIAASPFAASICRMTPFLAAFDTSACEQHVPLDNLVQNWTYMFSDPHVLELQLFAGIFLTNKAILTFSNDEFSLYDIGASGRRIYTGPGSAILKPNVSLAALIVISTLIFAQVLGLAVLTYFIYHVPSWTSALDGTAMARIGARLGVSVLPSLCPNIQDETKRLKSLDGCIGVSEGTLEAKETCDGHPSLGSSGIIRRRLTVSDVEKRKDLDRSTEGSSEELEELTTK